MRTFTALSVSVCFLALSGCSAVTNFTSTNTPTGPSSGSGATISGVVHGGQNPINGAHVYFYGVGNTGYGGQSVSLLTSSTKDASGNYYVTTAADGSFSVTGKYTCPVANSFPYAYILAVGGDSGSGNNSAATLVASLPGSCTDSGYSSIYAVVNEVSTVAAMYGAPAAITDLTHVSVPSGAQAVLSSVYPYNMYSVSTGAALATTGAGNGTVPQAEINTLANVIASCVNSNGAVTGPSNPTPCYTLFSNALSGGTTGTAPSDTATAALNIAHNPWANVASLFSLQTASAPFQPDLSAAPNDFTIALNFTGGGLNSPARLAIDASGDIWATNNGDKSVSQFNSDGSANSSSIGITGGGVDVPIGIAIDHAGNAWIANDATGFISLSELGPTGTPSTNSPFTGGGLAAPEDIAIDTFGNVWTPDLGTSSLSVFNSSGSPLPASPITTGGLNSPIFIAIDSAGNIWVSNSNGNSLSEFNSGGTAYAGSPFTGGGLNSPHGIAVDASNNIWVASRGNNVLAEFNASGPVSATGYTGGGLNQPNDVAVDSAGMIWVVNRGGNSISEFNSKGTPITGSTGYQGGSGTTALNAPNVLAIDSAGNIWVNNTGNNSITEFVGLASPVVTPIVGNFLNGYTHAASKP